MQKYLTRTAVIFIAAIWTGTAFAANQHDGHANREAEDRQPGLKSQETCPIMGGKINKDLYVDVQGQRVYTCCPMCNNAIAKDPEAAFQKLQKSGQHAESLQKVCPVMGGKINKDLYVEYQGRRLYACCPGCMDALKKNSEVHATSITAQLAKGEAARKQGETAKQRQESKNDRHQMRGCNRH